LGADKRWNPKTRAFSFDRGEVAMAIDIRVVQAGDFIRTSANGDLDVQVSKELLQRTAAEIKRTSIHHVLIDTRQATADWSTVAMYELATVFVQDPDLTHAKVALLTRHERIDKVRFMALVANNRGAHAMAFEDFEDAIDWLVTGARP
jgi:hypothetical protein